MRALSQLLLPPVAGFYLPGVAPKDYATGDRVALKVNSLTSVETHLPYEYYKLPFCAPDEIEEFAENIGELLTGNKLENSPYELFMNQNEHCKVLCVKKYGKADVDHFVERIKEDYVVNWVIDNMPAAENIVDSTTGIDYVFYEHGYHLGGKYFIDATASPEEDDEKNADGGSPNYYINNHVRITVQLHRSKEFKGSRVVGVHVSPLSIQHTYEGDIGKRIEPKSACVDPAAENRKLMVLTGPDASSDLDEKDNTIEVVFTYDVEWAESPIKWASRWDIYLSMGNRYSDEVHWFSIINSILIAVFLTGMVALILMRTLRQDLVFYNRVMSDEEKQEQQDESGWKLIHGQVRRRTTTRRSRARGIVASVSLQRAPARRLISIRAAPHAPVLTRPLSSFRRRPLPVRARVAPCPSLAAAPRSRSSAPLPPRCCSLFSSARAHKSRSAASSLSSLRALDS
jgi:transmembrane 9 superfamily protein 2/4